MAINATVVAAWKDGASAYLDVAVAGDGPGGANAEYVGSTPLLDDQGNAKSLAQLKTDLVAAVKAVRDAQKAQPQTVAITGTVSL